MRLRTKPDPDAAAARVPAAGPPLISLAWGSFAIAAGAVVAGLVVGQVVLMIGSTIDDRSGIDSWATLIATGAAVFAISVLVGRGIGAPRPHHLVIGATGPLILGLAFTLVAPSQVAALAVVVAYAALAVAGLRRGDRTRPSSS